MTYELKHENQPYSTDDGCGQCLSTDETRFHSLDKTYSTTAKKLDSKKEETFTIEGPTIPAELPF